MFSELSEIVDPRPQKEKKKKGKVEARRQEILEKNELMQKSLPIFTLPKFSFANRKDYLVIPCSEFKSKM